MSISEEFEAEGEFEYSQHPQTNFFMPEIYTGLCAGQMHLWNPDEPSTPRGNALPLCDLEERLQDACHQLSLPINGMATLQQLHALCQHIGIEVFSIITTWDALSG